jgi:predicted phosphodiesterase
MTKLAIISDIHSNQVALEAVLAVIDEEGADMIICTGDVVGYGPRPKECIDLLREREIPCLLGNHDQYVTLLMDSRVERLREEVRISVQWTQSQLPMDHLRWLAGLPMRFDIEEFDFALVHGAFGPKPWIYCNRPKHFVTSFAHQDVPLGFCGHSHVPAIGLYDAANEEASVKYLRQVTIPEADKVMINVGSVGQPRDKDPRSAFVFFSVEEQQVTLKRVEYDIEQTQAQIREAGLPEKAAARLSEGR